MTKAPPHPTSISPAAGSSTASLGVRACFSPPFSLGHAVSLGTPYSGWLEWSAMYKAWWSGKCNHDNTARCWVPYLPFSILLQDLISHAFLSACSPTKREYELWMLHFECDAALRLPGSLAVPDDQQMGGIVRMNLNGGLIVQGGRWMCSHFWMARCSYQMNWPGQCTA